MGYIELQTGNFNVDTIDGNVKIDLPLLKVYFKYFRINFYVSHCLLRLMFYKL